jgi:HAE1 family hydrophobic/amphiphilic exporter-1
MGGITGQFFKQFGLTVAVAVFISLLVARLITPVLAAYSLRSDSLVGHNADGPIMTTYLSMLRWCVAHRWKTIAAGTVFFCCRLLAQPSTQGIRAARGFCQR